MELAVAIVFGSGGLLSFIKWLLTWWGKRKHQNGLKSIQRIYQNINVLMTGLGAHRVAVFDSCNGGATPKAGSQLTVQTIYEMNTLKTPHGRGLWNQKTAVDLDLLNKLVELQDERPHSWKTLDLPEGPLQVMAMSMDSDKVILQKIGMDEKCMKVLAVFMPTCDDLLPAQEQLYCDVVGLLKTVRW